MALNFPNSPTNGQIYTDTLSGNSWTFDSANTCWKSTSTYIQTITVSSSAPGTPAVGQLWWNRDYGRLLVYYSDGDTSQWVDASPSDYTSALAYNQANAVSIVANTALPNTSGVTFAGNLTITGNTIHKNKTIVNYTPATNDNAAMYIASANTQGGNGYADFLKIQNISYPAVTNPNKSFRLTPTGTFEIINNAYTAAILGLDDSGNFSVAGTITNSSGAIIKNLVGSIRSSSPGNINFGTSYANINTTYYKWDLPSAGDYVVWCTVRARIWGLNTFARVRLYNNTAGSAVTNSDTMMLEFQSNNSALNVGVTMQWYFSASAATTLYLQGACSTSGEVGIQSDVNGYNEFGYIKIA